MKKIAVLVPSFTIEYCQDFLDGIFDYFSQKDVKVIVAQTQIEHNDTGLYDYQYWASVDILSSKEIDAYIIPAGLYTVRRSIEELKKSFKAFAPRPIICSAMDIELDNSYIVKIDSTNPFLEIVSHLKNAHGCKKIAFMSANSTKSTEAFERFEAYKKALKANDLEFSEDLVFDGFFTDFGARDNLLAKFTDKSQVPFDSLICANDNMAVGSIKALRQLGFSIPDDIKVTGFDNSAMAFYSNPKLSTVDQDIYSQGQTCAEIAFKVINGEKVEKETLFSPKTIFRQSCKCIEANNFEAIYKSYNGKIIPETNQMINLLSFMENNTHEKMNITTILDMIRSCNTLRQLFFNLKYLTDQAELHSLFINLYDTPLYIDKKDNPELPDNIELYMYAENLSYQSEFNPNIKFDTNENIFPPKADIETAGNFILQPIFAGESLFGYLTCKIKDNKFASYQVYLKILGTAISQSYEYTNKLIQTEKLSTEVTQLSDLAKTDELTKLLNRRGFMEIGQRTLDILQEINNAGVIFFADMDGLKNINDTYGHKMGDKAIQTQAQVLKKIFRNTDIIGRLSGDEFAIIANGMLIDRVPKVKEKLQEWSKKLSKQNGLPFTISISIGAVDLEGGSSLQNLLSKADKLLYEEKRIKHSSNVKIK